MPGIVSRQGFVIDKKDLTAQQLKQVQTELRVRADWDPNRSYGPPPPYFKVFLENDAKVCPPEYWARGALGQPERVCFDVKSQANMNFSGQLIAELRRPDAVAACMSAMHDTGGGILSLHTGGGNQQDVSNRLF